MTEAVSTAPATATSDVQTSTPQEPQFLGTKHKVKINGNEQEVTYEDLLAGYQLREASQKRFQEASELAKQTQPLKQFVEMLRSGDLTGLEHIVPEDVLRKFSEQQLRKYVEWQELPEAERARVVAERERDQYKSELQKRHEEQERARMEQIEHQEAAKIDTQISEAVSELGEDVKITPRFVRRVAEHLLANPDLDPKIAAKRAMEGLQSDYEEYQSRRFKKDPEKFIESLPKDIREAIRKRELKQAMDKQPWKRTSKDVVLKKKQTPTRGWDALEAKWGKE